MLSTDLLVIGGWSGELAATMQAVKFKASKVAVLDFFKPSPASTQWGVGWNLCQRGVYPENSDAQYGAHQ